MKKIAIEYCDLCPDFETCKIVEAGKFIGTGCPLSDDRTAELDAEVARLKAQLAELREAVAWYFEALGFYQLHINSLDRLYSSLNARSNAAWMRWRYHGKDSAEAILPAAKAELKRLAGVE